MAIKHPHGNGKIKIVVSQYNIGIRIIDTSCTEFDVDAQKWNRK